MKHNRWFQIFAIVLAASMILTACATTTPTVAPTQAVASTTVPTQASTGADTIIIGTTDTISSFDPADAYATRDWEVIRNIDEGLL